MADQKLADRTEALSADANDLIHIVDVSDPTDSAQGTSKKITKQNLTAGLLTANQTISLTGDASGSGTTSIPVVVANDSHTHDTRYFTEAESDARFAPISHNQASSSITDFTEATQDVVGGMVSTNSENGISVTYDDINGKLNFDVSDPTITLVGDVSGSAVMTNLGSVSITTTVANSSHTHTTADITNLSSYTGLDVRYYTEAEADARFLGISAKAADANLLDGIDSVTFARRDQANTFTGEVTAPSFKTDSWTIDQIGTSLEFRYNNVTKFTIDLNGNVIATGDGSFNP
jgi:hypothetical protein